MAIILYDKIERYLNRYGIKHTRTEKISDVDLPCGEIKIINYFIDGGHIISLRRLGNSKTLIIKSGLFTIKLTNYEINYKGIWAIHGKYRIEEPRELVISFKEMARYVK